MYIIISNAITNIIITLILNFKLVAIYRPEYMTNPHITNVLRVGSTFSFDLDSFKLNQTRKIKCTFHEAVHEAYKPTNIYIEFV